MLNSDLQKIVLSAENTAHIVIVVVETGHEIVQFLPHFSQSLVHPSFEEREALTCMNEESHTMPLSSRLLTGFRQPIL